MENKEYLTVVLDKGLSSEELNQIVSTIAVLKGVSSVQYTNEEEEALKHQRNKEEVLDKIKDFYGNMSDDEFRKRMEKAGFEMVEDKPGQFFAEEEGKEE